MVFLVNDVTVQNRQTGGNANYQGTLKTKSDKRVVTRKHGKKKLMSSRFPDINRESRPLSVPPSVSRLSYSPRSDAPPRWDELRRGEVRQSIALPFFRVP